MHGLEIGRIFLWDRNANKLVCGNAYNAASTADAIEKSQLFVLVPKAANAPQVVTQLPPRTGLRVLDIAVGNSHFCALAEDGGVRCFGQNDTGQCGKGPTFVATPQRIAGISDATAVVAGSGFSCALRRGGVVTCWGSNAFGELGPGPDDVGVVVTQSLGAVQLAAGQSHTCARLASGTVTCWGNSSTSRNESHQHYEADRDPHPRRVPGLADAIDICAHMLGTCARRKGGGIVCWGDTLTPVAGSEHAIAMSCNEASRSVPCWIDDAHHASCNETALPPLEHVASIELGADHACARRDDATVACWEKKLRRVRPDRQRHRQAQAGAVARSHIPLDLVELGALRGAKKIAVGTERSAAITADDALATWGYGPIGDGRACDGPPCDGLVPTIIPITPR